MSALVSSALFIKGV